MTQQHPSDSLNVSGITSGRSGRTTPRVSTPTTIRLEPPLYDPASPRTATGGGSPLSQQRVKVFSEPLPHYHKANARHAVPPLTEAQHRAAQTRSLSANRAVAAPMDASELLARYDPFTILTGNQQPRSLSPNAQAAWTSPKENNAARARRSCSSERNRLNSEGQRQSDQLLKGNVGAALDAIHRGNPTIGVVGSPTLRQKNNRANNSVSYSSLSSPMASASSPRTARACVTPRGTVMASDYASSVSYRAVAPKRDTPQGFAVEKSEAGGAPLPDTSTIKLQCRGHYSPIRNTFTPAGKRHISQLEQEAAAAKDRQKTKSERSKVDSV